MLLCNLNVTGSLKLWHVFTKTLGKLWVLVLLLIYSVRRLRRTRTSLKMKSQVLFPTWLSSGHTNISVTQINRHSFELVITTISQVEELKFRKGYGFTGIWVRKESASETGCGSTISKVVTPRCQLFLYLQANCFVSLCFLTWKWKEKKKWSKGNKTQLFNIKLFLCLLALLVVDYMKMPKEDTVVNCKLMHYIMQSSSARSFSTVHVFFICGSCPQVSKKYTCKPNLKKFFLELSHWETYSTFPTA